MTRYSISQPVTQVEAPRLLKGEGRYTDDVKLPFECHAVFLRSPHAHAAINGFDKADALALDGVVDVITGADWAQLGFGVIPTNSAVKENADGTPIAVTDQRKPISVMKDHQSFASAASAACVLTRWHSKSLAFHC